MGITLEDGESAAVPPSTSTRRQSDPAEAEEEEEKAPVEEDCWYSEGKWGGGGGGGDAGEGKWRRRRRRQQQKQEREWLELKRLEEEQEEVLVRALERQRHSEVLSSRQREVLRCGVGASETASPTADNCDRSTTTPVRACCNRRLSFSDQEEERQRQWEAIKRRASDEEERLQRELEKDANLRRRRSLDEERGKLQESVERQRLEYERRLLEERPRSASFSYRRHPPPKVLPRLISVEEEDKLNQWEELKRRESEVEERNLRSQEKQLELQRRQSMEEERQKLALSIEKQRVEYEERLEAERPRTASVSRGSKQASLSRCLSVEEEGKLNHWEDLKRRESEVEERNLRNLEKNLELQRHQSVEEERQKLALSIEQQRVEYQERLEAERPRTASVSRVSSARSGGKLALARCLSAEEEGKLNHWQDLKRRESEQEELQLRRLESRVQLERQETVEEERNKLANSVEKQRAEYDERLEAERPRKASVSRGRSKVLKRGLSGEEEGRLHEWEALKRKESDAEEIQLRQQERILEGERRKQEAEEPSLKAERVSREEMAAVAAAEGAKKAVVPLQAPEEVFDEVRCREEGVSEERPTRARPPLSKDLSAEESTKLEEWERLKRRESDAEEEMMREMERQAQRDRTNKTAEERASRSKQRHASDPTAVHVRGGEGHVGSESPTSRRRKEDEEDARLREWERLKRAESDQEEQMMREMEREAHRKKKEEREKFHQFLLDQCQEQEDRMLLQDREREMQRLARMQHQRRRQRDWGGTGRQPSSSSSTGHRTKSTSSLSCETESEASRLEWEEVRRRQEEDEEKARREEEREAIRKRQLQQAQFRDRTFSAGTQRSSRMLRTTIEEEEDVT